MSPILPAGLLGLLTLACLLGAPSADREPVPPGHAPTEALTAATAAGPTAVASPTRSRPTSTPRPPWCSEDPQRYLREAERLLDEADAAVREWNLSPRRTPQLEQLEARLRAVYDQAGLLTPPTDFEEVHQHYTNALRSYPYSFSGVVEERDEHRLGGFAVVIEELERMERALGRAMAAREIDCR